MLFHLMDFVKQPVATKHFPLNMLQTWEICRHQHTAGVELCPPPRQKNNRQSIKGGSSGGRDLFLFKELQQRRTDWAEGRKLFNQRVSDRIDYILSSYLKCSKHPDRKSYILVFPFTATINKQISIKMYGCFLVQYVWTCHELTISYIV